MSLSKVKAKKKQTDGTMRTTSMKISIIVFVTATILAALFFFPIDQPTINLEEARTALNKAIYEKRPQQRLSLVRHTIIQTQEFPSVEEPEHSNGALLWHAAKLIERSEMGTTLSDDERHSLNALARQIELTKVDTANLLTATLVFAQMSELKLGSQLADVLKKRSHPRDEILQAVAMMEFQAGKYDDAVESCRELTHVVPDDPMAWEMLVTIYEGRGLRLQLIDIYQKLISILPKRRDEYRWRLIIALMEVGDINRARSEYVIYSRESNPDQVLEAEILWLEGHVDRALALLEKVLNADSTNVTALTLTGRILLAQERFRESTKMLLQAIDVAPNNVETHYLLIQAYRSQGLKDMTEKHELIYERLHSDR